MEPARKIEEKSASMDEGAAMEMVHDDTSVALREFIPATHDGEFDLLAEVYVCAMQTRAPRKVNLCARVSELVSAIGTRFDLGDERIERLAVAGSIHRLGELALPDRLIDSCFLDHTTDDRATYKTYPTITAHYFRQLTNDVHLIAILGLHRQFYLDQKLSGADYDLRHLMDAQILCAATEYEELMVMKDAVDRDVVRRFMHRSRGLRYHPEVVDRLLEIVGH